MKIEYTRLFSKLKENKITQKDFREHTGISGATMHNLLHNGNITTNTICKICDYFHCMPDEILEFIPDSDYEQKRKEKEEIQAQIDALKAKLV